MGSVREQLRAGAGLGAGLVTRPTLVEHLEAPHFIIDCICRDSTGRIRWEDGFHNTVVTQGKNDLLTNYFKGSAYTAAFYLGLKGAGSVVAGDTAASHAGWAEANPYTGNRPAITFGTSSAGSNTATAIVYTVTAAGPVTVAGAFVQTVNTGTTGVLYSAGDFANSRTVFLNDTLTVTLTVSV